MFCRVAGTEAVTSEQCRHVFSLILKEVLWSDSLSVVVVVMANADNQTQRLRYRVWLQKLLSFWLLWIQVGCSGVTNNQQHYRKQAAQPAISFKSAAHPKYMFSQTPEEAGGSFSKLNKREKKLHMIRYEDPHLQCDSIKDEILKYSCSPTSHMFAVSTFPLLQLAWRFCKVLH